MPQMPPADGSNLQQSVCLTVQSQVHDIRKGGPRRPSVWPEGRDGRVEEARYSGLRQDAVVLGSSSRTALKAHLSSKSLSLFLLHEGGGNRTRTGRGQSAEGGEAAASSVGVAASSQRPSGEVATGCGVDVAVRGAPQVSVRPEGGGHGAVGRSPKDTAMFSKASSRNSGQTSSESCPTATLLRARRSKVRGLGQLSPGLWGFSP